MLSDSKLPGFYAFANTAISLGQKSGQNQKGRLQVHETRIIKVIFMILTENPFAVANDTQGNKHTTGNS